MDKSLFSVAQYELFVKELLIAYKEQPCLWKKEHPNYRNAKARNAAYDTLVKKALEFNEEADADFVRTKLDSLRTSFRKELRKVIQSKEQNSNPDDIYKPTLWYYDLLLFTVGEEAEEERVDENQTPKVTLDPKEVRVPYWGRDHTALLIKLYKTHPCLYSATHPSYKNKQKRVEAVNIITEKLIQVTGKNFHPLDVRKKISLIRGQFLYEYKKKSIRANHEPTLWCYKMLEFLKKEYSKPQTATKKKNQRKSAVSADSEDINFKQETCSSVSLESNLENNSVESTQNKQNEDVYDVIARNLIHQLNDMTNHQRKIAKKIVREVLYYGKTGQLTEKSKFNLNRNLN